MATEQRVLSRMEIERITMNAIASAGRLGIDRATLGRIVEWAARTRIDATLLEMVLDGRLGVAWKDGEPAFRRDDSGLVRTALAALAAKEN